MQSSRSQLNLIEARYAIADGGIQQSPVIKRYAVTGARYKRRCGGAESLTLSFPGEFIDCKAGVMGENGPFGRSVVPTMTLCVFNRSKFWNFYKTHPERRFDLTCCPRRRAFPCKPDAVSPSPYEPLSWHCCGYLSAANRWAGA